MLHIQSVTKSTGPAFKISPSRPLLTISIVTAQVQTSTPFAWCPCICHWSQYGSQGTPLPKPSSGSHLTQSRSQRPYTGLSHLYSLPPLLPNLLPFFPLSIPLLGLYAIPPPQRACSHAYAVPSVWNTFP